MIFLRCYNLRTNTCNGACQGCSDCPAHGSSRWTWIKFAVKSAWDQWLWDRVIGRHGPEIKDILLKNAKKRSALFLKKPFKDIKTWEVGTPVLVEKGRVAFLTESGDISIGSTIPGWADIYDINNFKPESEWFESKKM